MSYWSLPSGHRVVSSSKPFGFLYLVSSPFDYNFCLSWSTVKRRRPDDHPVSTLVKRESQRCQKETTRKVTLPVYTYVCENDKGVLSTPLDFIPSLNLSTTVFLILCQRIFYIRDSRGYEPIFSQCLDPGSKDNQTWQKTEPGCSSSTLEKRLYVSGPFRDFLPAKRRDTQSRV